MMSLKMWEYAGHYVIAESEQEATSFLVQELADLGEEPEGEIVWKALDDDTDFCFYDGDDTVTKTCAEWCAEHGKGYFASENW
jgi:hypothetical protein